jgi:hypothetical protein
MSDMLVQIMSYGTTQITERLDNDRRIAEKFATIGVLLAGVSALISFGAFDRLLRNERSRVSAGRGRYSL